MFKELLLERVWINSVESRTTLFVCIYEEFTGVISTGAAVLISRDLVGGSEGQMIVSARKSHERITIAYSRDKTVLVGHNLLAVDQAQEYDLYTEFTFRYGERLKILPLDEWLNSLKGTP